MREFSRRDVFKVGGSAAAMIAGSLYLGGSFGYLAGRHSAERRGYNLWPEAALLEAGGSKYVGRDIAVYNFQREGVAEEEVITLNVQAYRLPKNPYFGDDTTPIALISQGRSDKQGQQDDPFYGSSIVYLPTDDTFGCFPNGETKGEYVFNFGLPLKLGVSRHDGNGKAFYPRVYEADIYWGQQQVPCTDDMDLYAGSFVTERFPCRLVKVPQLIMTSPGKYEAQNDVPSILYMDGDANRAVPLPSHDLVDSKKPRESSFVVVRMGDLAMVNGLGKEPYSVLSKDVLHDTTWQNPSLDQNGVLKLYAPLSESQVLVARVTYIKGGFLKSLRREIDESEGIAGYQLPYSVSRRSDQNGFVLPEYDTGYSLKIVRPDKPISYAGGIDRVDILIEDK